MKGWGINNRVLYRRAMSIQHRMERIEKTERPTKEKTLRARFGEKEFHGDEVLTVKNLSKQFGGRTLFSGVELTVRGGERIALLGDNGTGKSTSLKHRQDDVPARAARRAARGGKDQVRSVRQVGLSAAGHPLCPPGAHAL